MRRDAGDETGWLVGSIAPAVLSGIALICISALAAFRRVNARKLFEGLMA
jgi:hypothetical protein